MDGSWLTSASGREGWRGKQDKGRGPPRRRLLAAALVCALRDAIRRRRRVFNITSAHTAGWRACTTHVSCYCSFTLIFTHSSVLCARLSCGVTPVSCSEFSGSVSSIESFKIKCYPVIKLVLGVGSGDGQNVKAKNFERRSSRAVQLARLSLKNTQQATGLASTTAAVCWKLRDHVHLGVVTCLGHRFSRARGLEIYCTLLYGCDDEKTHSAGPRALR